MLEVYEKVSYSNMTDDFLKELNQYTQEQAAVDSSQEVTTLQGILFSRFADSALVKMGFPIYVMCCNVSLLLSAFGCPWKQGAFLYPPSCSTNQPFSGLV